MAKLDPIIAVRDVEFSSMVPICVQLEEWARWGADAHPTMENSDVTAGNGLILYFAYRIESKMR